MNEFCLYFLRVTQVTQLVYAQALLPSANPLPPYVLTPVQALQKTSFPIHYLLIRTHLPNLPTDSVLVVFSAPHPAQPLPASSSSPDQEKVRHKSSRFIFSVNLNNFFLLIENIIETIVLLNIIIIRAQHWWCRP